MSNAAMFIALAFIFCLAGGVTFGIMPALGGAFFGCAIVAAVCSFANFLEGR